jgi:hypothetical protein
LIGALLSNPTDYGDILDKSIRSNEKLEHVIIQKHAQRISSTVLKDSHQTTFKENVQSRFKDHGKMQSAKKDESTFKISLKGYKTHPADLIPNVLLILSSKAEGKPSTT